MPGRGPAPKDPADRRRPNSPTRGDWTHADGIGWQHGDKPKPPSGLLAASREAWAVWLDAWFAYFWTPSDVPALRHLIRLYDAVERGELQRHAEMRIAMDSFGITPKGQRDARIRPPLDGEVVGEIKPDGAATSGRYAHLRGV